ncbi:MAG: hypothetical protein JO122_12810 [Acetobacteraceae bacterium]|nr:hypothetical protein [Acetobacteraceae bacterium]
MASRVAWLPLVTLMLAGTALGAAPNQQGTQPKQSKGWGGTPPGNGKGQ